MSNISPGRALFLYAPGGARRMFEAASRLQPPLSSIDDHEVAGPNFFRMQCRVSVKIRAVQALAWLLSLAGCAETPVLLAPPAPYSCVLPAAQRMLVAELFFGRGIRGRGQLTDAEWAEFTVQTITPNFPDGFTVFDGEGQWRNPRNGHIAGGPTKILLVATKREPDLARRLSAVIDAYKLRFNQQSVGVITRDSCGAF